MRPVLWFVLLLLAVPFFSAHARLERPDIIVIVTDDQRPETLPFMRHTTRLLVDGGVNFTRAFASTALCCPARATLLKGVYSHNHGVLADGADYVRQFRDDSTLATWLSKAGYQTALFGKYLSPYNPDVFQPWPYVPPRWDNWRVFGGLYYGYKVVGANGWYRDSRHAPEDYQTTSCLACRGIPGDAGRSLVGLIAKPGSSWRRGLLLESLAGRGLAKYQGVRTDRYVYVKYRSGKRELYDLRLDPDQLTNVVADPDYTDKLAQLKIMVDRLRDR